MQAIKSQLKVSCRMVVWYPSRIDCRTMSGIPSLVILTVAIWVELAAQPRRFLTQGKIFTQFNLNKRANLFSGVTLFCSDSNNKSAIKIIFVISLILILVFGLFHVIYLKKYAMYYRK